MDPAQILLIVVVIVLTFLLVILGLQVYFILSEFRKTLSKTNKVLDNAFSITESVSAPLSKLSSLANGIQLGTIVGAILKMRKKKREED